MPVIRPVADPQLDVDPLRGAFNGLREPDELRVEVALAGGGEQLRWEPQPESGLEEVTCT